MLVVMKAHATEEQVRAVCQKIESLGYRAHAMPGAQRTAIGITGNKSEVEPGTLDEMAGVQEVIRVSKPYKLVSRDVKEETQSSAFPAPTPPSAATAGHHRRPVRHREPRAGLRRRRARRTRRRAIFPRRRLQAAHLSLLVPGPGRRRPEDHGRNPRQVRPADRHRSHRQRIARAGRGVCGRDPDRRPQHAEFLSAQARRPRAQAGAAEARHVGDAGRIPDGRRVHHERRQLQRRSSASAACAPSPTTPATRST